MSEDKNTEPFDFDFDALNADAPQAGAGEDSFDLENPFGDDLAPLQSISEEEMKAEDPFGDNIAAESSAEGEEASEAEESTDSAPEGEEKADTKKKGWFSKSKSKPAKEKPIKEKKEKPKKEKVVKEKKPAGEPVPRDWGTILCIAFSVFLLVSLLMVNIAAFLTSGSSMMQTLCFLGAFNVIGLAAASVPILFYKFPKERTLPNIMLGIAAVAIFSTLLMAVVELSRYDFILKP